jgi:glycosyltransferase involved in cell wall biosynthesis
VIERRRIAVYYNVGWGGGRRWLYDTVSRLSRYHDMDLYCLDRDSIGRQYPDVREFSQHESVAVPFRDLPRVSSRALRPLNAPLMFADFLRFDRASRDMAKRIDAAGYDLVFASIGGYTEAPLVLRHLRTPSAYYCHEPMRQVYETPVPRPYPRNPGVRALRRMWHRMYYGTVMRAWDVEGTRRARLVLTNSRYTADYARRVYGVDPEVNYAGVDTDAFAPGEAPHERFVLTVGELMSRKGFDWAVRAVGSIPAAQRPKLVLVANNTEAAERRYVEGVARDCGVELEIRERVPDAELKRLYQVAGVFLYTPHLEPLGLAALEAMASGTPVVAVREAGPAETVIDGESGFLCERDAAALGAAVLRVLDDDGLRARMGRAAREDAVRRWTSDRSAEELASLLSGAVQAERARQSISTRGIGDDPRDTIVARRRS